MKFLHLDAEILQEAHGSSSCSHLFFDWSDSRLMLPLTPLRIKTGTRRGFSFLQPECPPPTSTPDDNVYEYSGEAVSRSDAETTSSTHQIYQTDLWTSDCDRRKNTWKPHESSVWTFDSVSSAAFSALQFFNSDKNSGASSSRDDSRERRWNENH